MSVRLSVHLASSCYPVSNGLSYVSISDRPTDDSRYKRWENYSFFPSLSGYQLAKMRTHSCRRRTGRDAAPSPWRTNVALVARRCDQAAVFYISKGRRYADESGRWRGIGTRKKNGQSLLVSVLSLGCECGVGPANLVTRQNRRNWLD